MTQITIPKEEYDVLKKAFDSIQNKDNAIFTYGTEKSFVIISCKTKKEAFDQFKKDLDEVKQMVEQRDESLKQFGQANKKLNDELIRIKKRNLWQRILNK